jgi:hypothetical protein
MAGATGAFDDRVSGPCTDYVPVPPRWPNRSCGTWYRSGFGRRYIAGEVISIMSISVRNWTDGGVVVGGDRVQADGGVFGGVRCGNGQPVWHPAQHPDLALEDVTEGAGVQRVEGGAAGGVGFGDPSGGVDLVGEDDEAALVPGGWGGGGVDGGEEVGGPVGSGEGGISIAPVTTIGSGRWWSRSNR